MTVGVIHLDQTAPHAARDRSSYSVVVGYTNALGIVNQQEAGIDAKVRRPVACRQAGEAGARRAYRVIAPVDPAVLLVNVDPVVAYILHREGRVLSKLVLNPQV